jgi:hypothetical protein
MMKLRFEQVLEYVEQGENDRRMKKRLQMDPDGPELLRQARLMHDMMKLRAEKGAPDEDWAGSGADSAAQFDSVEVAEVHEQMKLMLSESAASYQRDDDRMSLNDVSQLQNLAGRAAGRIREIGSIRLIHDGHRVAVSFEPDDDLSAALAMRQSITPTARRDLTDDDLLQFKRRRPVPNSVEVRGHDLSISVNAETTVDGTLVLRIIDRRLSAPARGLQLLFMPEEGSFVRFHTDAKGVARFSVPDCPGILRIESQQPQLLHIKIEK